MPKKVKTWLENIDDSDYRYKTIQDEIEKLNEIDKITELLSTGTYFDAYHKIHINLDEDIIKKIIVLIHGCDYRRELYWLFYWRFLFISRISIKIIILEKIRIL
jgi:hypothetical protein